MAQTLNSLFEARGKPNTQINAEWVTHTPEETMSLGQRIGHHFAHRATLSEKKHPSTTILCFFGDLGAGKTTLIKGIVHGVTGISTDEVVSPTFMYLVPYQGFAGPSVYHFDLYRLRDPEEFLGMGFDDYFFAGGICCIEWSERIVSLLPPHTYSVYLTHEEMNRRRIRLFI